MKASPSEEVTKWLIEWSKGDKDAFDKLAPLVYDELRRLARFYMRKEAREHTLQATALVNEVYLRLINQRDMSWQNRAHFFAISAQLMRRVLIDHARKHSRKKRSGEYRKEMLNEAAVLVLERSSELVALDDALNALSLIDERKSRVVELRYFGGLSIEETAEVLKVSAPTVQREWRAAKAWLFGEVSKKSIS
jgi:RNA polymerase sigma-70 factor, ECF subfamily